MLQDEANKHMIHGIRQDSGEMHSAFPRTWRLWLREINSGFKPRGLRLWLGEVELRWSFMWLMGLIWLVYCMETMCQD